MNFLEDAQALLDSIANWFDRLVCPGLGLSMGSVGWWSYTRKVFVKMPKWVVIVFLSLEFCMRLFFDTCFLYILFFCT
jgi:hypothetical protein